MLRAKTPRTPADGASPAQTKYGILDMEDKQRLFKVIQRLNAEDSGTSANNAAQPSDKRRASNGRQSVEQQSYDSSARALQEHDLLDNNNLLDLDDIDGSGDFLSPVSVLLNSKQQP